MTPRIPRPLKIALLTVVGIALFSCARRFTREGPLGGPLGAGGGGCRRGAPSPPREAAGPRMNHEKHLGKGLECVDCHLQGWEEGDADRAAHDHLRRVQRLPRRRGQGAARGEARQERVLQARRQPGLGDVARGVRRRGPLVARGPQPAPAVHRLPPRPRRAAAHGARALQHGRLHGVPRGARRAQPVRDLPQGAARGREAAVARPGLPHLARGRAGRPTRASARSATRTPASATAATRPSVRLRTTRRGASATGRWPRPSRQKCQFCHTDPAACDRCHQATKPSSHGPGWLSAHGHASIARTERCEMCHTDPDDCVKCHLVTKPASHDHLWMERHGDVAINLRGRAEGRCEMCHLDPNFCQSCHAVEEPRNHTHLFRTRTHGIQAAIDRASCQVCHESDFCIRCHEDTPPRSHGPMWASGPNLHCAQCHFPIRFEGSLPYLPLRGADPLERARPAGLAHPRHELPLLPHRRRATARPRSGTSTTARSVKCATSRRASSDGRDRRDAAEPASRSARHRKG